MKMHLPALDFLEYFVWNCDWSNVDVDVDPGRYSGSVDLFIYFFIHHLN